MKRLRPETVSARSFLGEAVYRVVGKWLKGVHPVSTGIIVQGLARPELLMEIDVFAVIPDAPAKPVKTASRARNKSK